MSLTIASSESASMLVTIQHIKSVDTTRLPLVDGGSTRGLAFLPLSPATERSRGAGFVNLVL
jgi:hypothetical protein